MNAITLSGPVADALGWTLVHAVWQGFALVLPIAILLHVLRNRSSALRYRMGVAGLLSQVLASIVTFGWLYKPVAAVSAVAMTGMASQTVTLDWQRLPQILPWPVQVQQFLATHLGEFVLLYLIGVAVFAIRLAGGWLYLQRLSRTATQPASDRVNALVQSLQKVMQLGPVVRVCESVRVAVPMVVGVLKPILLLPVGLVTNLSIAEVEAVLAHELAHVKRHDYAVNLLQSVMEVLYFFHPALWWLSARLREEREHCCDDLAIKTIGGNGRTLAQALAHVEELRLTQLTTPALAMALSSKRQLLLHRVRRMLGVPTRPFVSNGSLAGLTLATLLLLSVSVYAVQQQPQPKPDIKKSQPKSTRRHKVNNGTEFGISDDKKLDYVIWKGQKLPASRVAKLQKLYEQVMAGQLSLDNVKQPDRDILLQIIEVNHAFSKGMDGLSEGLGQIDYNNIVASATHTIDSVEVNGDQIKIKSYRYSMNDSLPALQVTLTKLQRANTEMRMELQLMEHDWQMRVKELRETFMQRQKLLEEKYALKKQALHTQKLIEKPSLSPVKQALTDEFRRANEQMAKLRQRIDSIDQNEIDSRLDRTHFNRLRTIMDSVRVNESEIIEISRELSIEPTDRVSVPPVAPRPPKPPRSVVKPAPPAPSAPRPAPKP